MGALPFSARATRRALIALALIALCISYSKMHEKSDAIHMNSKRSTLSERENRSTGGRELAGTEETVSDTTTHMIFGDARLTSVGQSAESGAKRLHAVDHDTPKLSKENDTPKVSEDHTDPEHTAEEVQAMRNRAISRHAKIIAAEAKVTTPTAVVYRIIENDYRAVKETADHIRYVLEREKGVSLPGALSSRWIINRLHDVEELNSVEEVLKEYGAEYSVIPFEWDEYREKKLVYEGRLPIDILRSGRYYNMPLTQRLSVNHDIYKYKKNYVTNRRGGRALAIGEAERMDVRPDWVILLDWDVLLLPEQWANLRHALREMTSNKDITQLNIRSADVSFRLVDHTAAYMPRQYRVGRIQSAIKLAPVGEKTKRWREPSKDGASLEQPILFHAFKESKPHRMDRGYMVNLFDELKALDTTVAAKYHGFTDRTLLMYNETILQSEKLRYRDLLAKKVSNPTERDLELKSLIDTLIKDAEYSKTQGPWSVTYKTELPPSRNKHDYYSVKPYYWPDPNTKTGLPYIRRDGERIPGSVLYDVGSEKYDRTALANMFRNTTVLILAYHMTEDETYAKKAVDNVRVWFLNEETRQTPHSMYAQIHWGVNGNLGRSTGVLEFRSVFFFLDAMRLLEASTSFTEEDSTAFKKWMTNYSNYLDTSKQAKTEYKHDNNHGTFFDVQRLALAAYLNDIDTFLWLAQSDVARILEQFDHDGSMPEEMIRPTQLHYMMFALQGWLIVAHMASRAGVDLWSYTEPGEKRPALLRSSIFTIPCFNETWSHHQTKTEDMTRMYPMAYQALEGYPELSRKLTTEKECKLPSLYKTNPAYHELDGPHMYWNLGLSTRYGIGSEEEDQ